MRIAHVVCTFPPAIGGMGMVAFQLASEQLARGHEVEVFTPRHEAENDEVISYVERLQPTLAYGRAAILPQLAKHLEDFDIIHFHYPFYGVANLIRRFKKKHPHIGLVITYHMDNRAPGWLGMFFRAYATWYMPRVLDSADAILGSTFDYIASSDANGHFIRHGEKWHELPFGVDIETFQPRDRPMSLFLEHGLQPKIPTVLFVGGMDREHHFKGVPVLLQALQILKKQGTPVQGLFVGEGGLRQEFELLAQGLGVRALATFTGRVSAHDLPYYYNAADVFVLPSVHRGEAFGLVLLEAMASGVPVVASDLPGMRSIARLGGWTVPPKNPTALAEAIAACVFDSDHEMVAQTARRRVVESFSWGDITHRLDAIYTQVLANIR